MARSVALMLQTSAAVAAAHEAGIIHRDLKPANIFIVQHPEVPAVVKVLDFGIAKLASELLDDEDSLTLTQVGAMIGTPRYMSPEQCDGAELTPAADVYSLGCILYEMLTGTVPFSGATPLAIAVRQTSETPAVRAILFRRFLQLSSKLCCTLWKSNQRIGLRMRLRFARNYSQRRIGLDSSMQPSRVRQTWQHYAVLPLSRLLVAWSSTYRVCVRQLPPTLTLK